MWCKSAVSFSCGFLVAACRIRSTACDTPTRPCVRYVLWSCEFPLVEALPSGNSAGAFAPLFAAFIGTPASSDFFIPCTIGYGILLPAAAPVRLPGQNEDLPGPDEGRTNVHGFSDTVESSIPSPVAVMAVLPSSCIPSFCSHQITPKTSRYTRCSTSMLPNVSINGRSRSSGQLGRWWYSISPCRNNECVRRFTVFAFNQRS